jgi:hypothetical protein
MFILKIISYCFVLFNWILEKIRFWFDLVWIMYAKVKIEIRKQKREKEERRKKMYKRARGNETGPVQLSARSPLTPESQIGTGPRHFH